MVTCPSCGHDGGDDAKFCPECGAALARVVVAPKAARKVVTLLFSDVAGSTALGERLDPESLSRVMASYFQAMRAEVELNRPKGGG